jgi:hypothetical protein
MRDLVQSERVTTRVFLLDRLLPLLARGFAALRAAAGWGFPRGSGGVRAEWQDRPKTLAQLQRIPATRCGSRWQSG